MKNVSKLFAFILIFTQISALVAQQSPVENTPLDPKVIYGTLPNGMKYYIRQNAKPEERAEFYIVHNVGAILEDDDQNGLAHFTEHMAFNGTKNFPKKGILDFMEKNGVAFGHNVNAFTGQDVTAYMLSKVPTTREGLIDTSLLVLHDWSSFISFEAEEIDAERGVIHEEWRTGKTPDRRMRTKVMPALYNNSKYAKRDVIGDINVIDNFKHEIIKRFYTDWYRPDLQALIIIGDFDPKKMEQKVLNVFSDIPKRENTKPRFDIEIPNNSEPLIGIATDKEAERTMVTLLFKHDIVKNKDMNYVRNQLVGNLYSLMLNNRFSELTQKANPPFIYAYTYYGDIARTKSAYYSVALVKKGMSKNALNVLLTENQRLRQHGFTESELERAKKDLLVQIETQYKERDKTESENYVWVYFSHFLTNEPALGIEFEYEYTGKTLQTVSLEEINKLAGQRITDENIVVTITGPEGSEIPTEAEISELLKNFKTMQTEAYADDTLNEPLMKKTPKAKKAKNTTEENGVTEIQYDNGAKVIYKKTDFKEDEIQMSAYKFGGYSNTSDADINSARLAADLVAAGGVGNFSATQLQKKLAGKNISVRPKLNSYTHGFSGNSTPQDFETLLQLINLYFTAPRADATAGKAEMQKYESFYENKALNPASRFSDSLQVIVTNKNKRTLPMNKAFFTNVTYEKAYESYKEAFSDANDFVFVFVGNIDPKQAQKLFDTYIGSLPSKGKKGAYTNHKIYPPKGVTEKEIEFKLEVPKSTVYVNFNGTYEYSPLNNLELAALEHIIDLRYIETIREQEGGTYGVGVYKSTNKHPESRYMVHIRFDCAPEKAEQLTQIVYREIEKIKENGPTDEDLQKTIEYFQKTRQENLKENSFWLEALVEKSQNGIDNTSSTKYDEILSKITKESLKKAANLYFNMNQRIELTMKPAK